MNMSIYQKLYLKLFNAITDALEQMDQLKQAVEILAQVCGE